MADPVENNAASTPVEVKETQEITDSGNPLEALSSEQRDKWLQTGELPASPSKEESASSTSEAEEPENKAEVEETPAKTDPEPVEEPKQEHKKGKSNAETRKVELAAEIQAKLSERAQLRDELEQMRREKEALATKPADPPPAPFKDPSLVEPKEEDFTEVTEFIKAQTRYQTKLELAEERAREQKETEKRQAEERDRENNARLNKNIAEAKKRVPDLDKSISAVQKGLVPLNAAVEKIVLNSEYGPDILHQLWLDKKNAVRISKLGEIDTYRELLAIEQTLKAPKTKTVSSASPPPKEVGGNNTVSTDEAQAALEAGDFVRYQKVMNAKDAARFVR